MGWLVEARMVDWDKDQLLNALHNWDPGLTHILGGSTLDGNGNTR